MAKTIETQKYIEYTTSAILLRHKVTGEEIYLDSLESDKLAKTIDTEDIKGGITNETFVTINKNEKITFEAVDVLSREGLNIAKWGGTLKTGSDLVATCFPTNKAIIATGEVGSEVYTITLDETPIDTDTVVLFDNKNGEELVETTDYTVSGKEITIIKSGLTNADTIYVSSYDYVAPALTEYYDVTGSGVSAMFEAIIRKPIFDMLDNIKYWRETHIPKVQMDTAIEQSGNTEKGKQAVTHTFSVLKDDAYDYKMRVIHIKVAE